MVKKKDKLPIDPKFLESRLPPKMHTLFITEEEMKQIEQGYALEINGKVRRPARIAKQKKKVQR